MRSGRATMAAVCGGLVVLAGLLWWQSAFGLTSLPKNESEPTAAGAQKLTGEAGTLEGEGKLPTGDSDADREQLISRPVGKQAEPTHGSLLLSVVYGDDNSPAPGIEVFVQEVTVQGPRATPRRFKTSEKGRVRVSNLRPGKVYVRTYRQAMEGKFAEVVAGEETEFTLALKDGVDISGMVVDGDGLTVADAEIVLAGWAAVEPHIAARSDERGRFSLRQVPEKSNLGARAKGFAPSPLRTITAAAGANVDIRIVLPGPGGGVRGRVLDPDGNGVADVLVRIGTLERDFTTITLPDGSRGVNPRAAETRTDAEGRFEVEGLPPGKIPVLARGKTFAPWIGSVDVVARMTTPFVIRLQPGVTCQGTVHDSTGKPADRVEVHHGAYGAPERRNTRTAADGSYRLEGLPVGEIIVQARGKERGNASVKLNGVSGQTLRWDATLSKGRQLEILVLDEVNNPLEKVQVLATGRFLKGTSSWFRHGSTNKQGKITLVDCPKVPLFLRLRKPEYASVLRYDVDATVGRLVVQMKYEGKPTARIVGTVLDPDGKPVAAAELLPIRSGDPGSRVYNATADGKIDIGELRPGSYRLLVRAGAYPSYMSPKHELLSGETWDVGIVQLVRGSCVQVQVINAAELAKDIPRVYMTVSKRGGGAVAGINTRQLPLRSAPVAPGSYVLTVSGPTVIPQEVPIRVSEDRDTQVQIKIRLGAPRVFEFVLPVVADKVDRMEMTLVGGGGSFTRQLARWQTKPFQHKMGLAPGGYKLVATTKEGHRGQLEFDVPAADAAARTSKTIRLVLK